MDWKHKRDSEIRGAFRLVKEEVRKLPPYARVVYDLELSRTGNQFFALSMARAEIARYGTMNGKKPPKRLLTLEPEEKT
jgi:hypothetical protein